MLASVSPNKYTATQSETKLDELYSDNNQHEQNKTPCNLNEALKQLLRQDGDLLKAYSITEKNAHELKPIRKFCLLNQKGVNWYQPLVDRESENSEIEKSGLFISNILLTTKVKALIEENSQLRKRLDNNNVS